MDKIYDKQIIGPQCNSKKCNKEIFKMSNDILSKTVKGSPPTPQKTTKEISCKFGLTNKEKEGKKYVNSINNEVEQKTVTILDDSVHVNSREICKKLNSKCQVFVKHFSGIGTRCTKEYIKPSLRQKPQDFKFYVGPNELYTKRSPQITAKSTVNLTSTLKINLHGISKLNIIFQAGNTKLNDRATWVNCHLVELCKKRNLYIMDHMKTTQPRHLNKSQLHVN